jgi:hypothetical protein
MVMFKRLRLTIVSVIALGAVFVVGVAPVGAAVDSGCSGRCGSYQVDDSTSLPGAKCSYGTSFPYKLNWISVRPPLMHGDYAAKTPVAWRFRIQRKPNSSGSFKNYFTSSYQQSTANVAIPAYAGHGFSRRTWNAPNNPAGYRYRVILDLIWKKNGSVEGSAHVRYEVYNRVSGMNSDKAMGYCLQSY